MCTRSECGLHPSLWRCVSICPISYHKAIGGRSSSRLRAGRATSSPRRITGRSRRVAAASHRSWRSARRLGPRERLALYTSWVSQDSHVPWSSRGGARVSSGLIARQTEELEESFAAGPALQLSLFQDTSDWPPFVLSVQSRRRREKWTRTRKARLTRQCNARLRVCFYSSFFFSKNFTRRRRRASSASRSSPTPASLVKTRSRHTSRCRFSFRDSAIHNGLMLVLDTRQLRTGKSEDRGLVSFVFVFV